MANENQGTVFALNDKQLQYLADALVEHGKGSATYEMAHLDAGKGEEPWRALPMWGTLGQAADLYNRYLLDRSAPKPGFGDEVHNMFYAGRPAERLYGSFTSAWSWIDTFYALPIAWTTAEEFIMANKDKVADMRKGFESKHGDALNQINVWENTGNWPTEKRGDVPHAEKANVLEALGMYKEAGLEYAEAYMNAQTAHDKAAYLARARMMKAASHVPDVPREITLPNGNVLKVSKDIDFHLNYTM